MEYVDSTNFVLEFLGNKSYSETNYFRAPPLPHQAGKLNNTRRTLTLNRPMPSLRPFERSFLKT